MYVILGASAAGINGVRELRRLDKDADITLISKDDKEYIAVLFILFIWLE
jgi:NADPH-dependent 2,4-dienoyl-CoA reductase/sulfur reductase-like enzyme